MLCALVRRGSVPPPAPAGHEDPDAGWLLFAIALIGWNACGPAGFAHVAAKWPKVLGWETFLAVFLQAPTVPIALIGLSAFALLRRRYDPREARRVVVVWIVAVATSIALLAAWANGQSDGSC